MKTRSVASNSVDDMVDPVDSDTDHTIVNMSDKRSKGMGDCNEMSIPKKVMVKNPGGATGLACHDDCAADRRSLPRTLGELDEFVHLCHTNRSSLRCFNELIAPLMSMVGDNSPFEWTSDTITAYENLCSQMEDMHYSPATRRPDVSVDIPQMNYFRPQQHTHTPDIVTAIASLNSAVAQMGATMKSVLQTAVAELNSTSTRVLNEVNEKQSKHKLNSTDSQVRGTPRPVLRRRESVSSSDDDDDGPPSSVISFSSGSNVRSRRIRQHTTGSKLPPFTGKESWDVWFTRFQLIADRSSWSENKRLDELLPKLQGVAGDFVFSQLDNNTRNNYKRLVNELHFRFRVIENSRTYKSQFSHRDQHSNESVEEYAAELKRLYNKAHPNRDNSTRDEDLLRRLLDGLSDSQARFHVEYIKNPENIDQAAFEVVNFLETKAVWSGQDRRRQPTRMVRSTTDESEERNHLINNAPGPRQTHGIPTTSQLRSNQPTDRRYNSRGQISPNSGGKPGPGRETRTCYNCGNQGHLSRYCPEPRHPRQWSPRGDGSQHFGAPMNNPSLPNWVNSQPYQQWPVAQGDRPSQFSTASPVNYRDDTPVQTLPKPGSSLVRQEPKPASN